MKFAVLFHGGLLIVALLSAFTVWTGEPKHNQRPVIAELEADDISKIDFTWPDGEAKVIPKGKGDDLTKITGIGPVAKKQLNEQGLTTFAQLAKLTAADIKRIDEAMPFSAEQISDWRDQAKALSS